VQHAFYEFTIHCERHDSLARQTSILTPHAKHTFGGWLLLLENPMNDCGNSESLDQKLEHLKLADERWKMVRSAIEHEDNLINQRLGWLFIGHAILFVCFAMLQKDVLSSEHKLESALAVELGLAVLFLCAGFIAMVTHRSNAVVNNHIGSLRQWWTDNGLATHTTPTVVAEASSGLVAEQFDGKSNLEPVSSNFLPTNFPPIAGHVPEKRGSIPTLIALMDLVLLVICLGISSQKFLDSQLTASIPRVVESRVANEGNPGTDSSDQQSDVGTSQEGGNSVGSEEGGGGERTSGALNVP
jgi:hypothetical protein